MLTSAGVSVVGGLILTGIIALPVSQIAAIIIGAIILVAGAGLVAWLLKSHAQNACDSGLQVEVGQPNPK